MGSGAASIQSRSTVRRASPPQSTAPSWPAKFSGSDTKSGSRAMTGDGSLTATRASRSWPSRVVARTLNRRLRVKAWPAPRRRRTSRIARDCPKINATSKRSRRNGVREAVIDRRALEARALQHAMGQTDLHLIRIESERFRQDGRLIVAGDSVDSPRGAYTTPEMIALERGNIELMRAGQGRAAAIGSPNEVRRWASQRSLLPDQTAVAQLTLTSTDWITSIEGRAGAAKTTTVGAIREFAEDQGYIVFGFAPTTRAVKSLSEAGISARTVASLLESQSAHDASNEVWIIDESSLLPTRQVNRLLHKALEQNVERMVLVGDQRQHHAIEAGRPIYQMQQAGMLDARLDTIRRQRDPELREAVMHAAKGQVAESLTILERRGDIRELRDIEPRRRQIAREYLVAHESGERVLVVSPANDERRELNRTIRAELVARGHVDPLGQEHTILVSRNISGAQRAIAYNYEEGDLIRFTRGSKQFAIPRGAYGRVEAVDRVAHPAYTILSDEQRQ